jgi:hypothetical protein
MNDIQMRCKFWWAALTVRTTEAFVLDQQLMPNTWYQKMALTVTSSGFAVSLSAQEISRSFLFKVRKSIVNNATDPKQAVE